MVVNKKKTVIFRNVMPCPLVECYYCLGGTDIHNPEGHSLNQHSNRMVPQLAHTLQRYINFINIFLLKPSAYYNTKHVN